MVVVKKTKAVTHRQQSSKIGSRRDVGSGGNGNCEDNGKNDDGYGDSDNDNNDDGSVGGGRRAMAAADGMVWGRRQAARGSRPSVRMPLQTTTNEDNGNGNSDSGNNDDDDSGGGGGGEEEDKGGDTQATIN